MTYLWLKAFHLIFMVAWFAGLFYIFRLFVYHVQHRSEPAVTATLTVMERKLIRFIIHPAMGMTILFGLLLIRENPAVLTAPWFWAKLGAVFFLIAYQIFAAMTHNRFSRNDYFLSERNCRIINEIPTVLLIVIILLVVLKP